MKFGDLVSENYLDGLLENKKQELKENEWFKRARFIKKERLDEQTILYHFLGYENHGDNKKGGYYFVKTLVAGEKNGVFLLMDNVKRKSKLEDAYKFSEIMLNEFFLRNVTRYVVETHSQDLARSKNEYDERSFLEKSEVQEMN